MPEVLKSGEPCLALIVDDEESIRKTLADVFEDEGWQSVTAENGKVGLLDAGNGWHRNAAENAAGESHDADRDHERPRHD
jgi:CheY-like chemotaxis protein